MSQININILLVLNPQAPSFVATFNNLKSITVLPNMNVRVDDIFGSEIELPMFVDSWAFNSIDCPDDAGLGSELIDELLGIFNEGKSQIIRRMEDLKEMDYVHNPDDIAESFFQAKTFYRVVDEVEDARSDFNGRLSMFLHNARGKATRQAA